MSKYTITIRNIEELIGNDELKSFFTDYELSDFLLPEQIQTITKANIWSKEKLAQKIIDHYYTREIGYETIRLFKHHVKIKLKEIMEEKAPLIYSKCIEFDPLINVDFTETFDRNITGNLENKNNGKFENTGDSSSNSTNMSTSSSNSKTTSKNLDTPENEISNLESNKYISSANISDNTSNINDNTTNKTTNNSSNSGSNSNQTTQNTENIEHYTRSQKGNSGSLTTAQNLIQQFRNIIITIDKDIINELNPLFMGIF